MTFQTIQYAFAAGEISPTFLGRQDLEKYDLGLALARNFYVDYRGGLTTRAGMRFVDYVWRDNQATKFFRFNYAPDDANTYVVLFGHNYIRFLQGGAYVLEAPKAVTSITAGTPGVVNATAHGFSAGNWVKLYGRTFEVGTVTTDTFQLKWPDGTNFVANAGTIALGATTVQRIYTVTSPYSASALAKLRAYQHLNKLYLTHPDYAPRELSRVDHAQWTLALTSFTAPSGMTSSTSVTSGGDDEMSITYAVTAVNADKQEGLPFYATAVGVTRFNDLDDFIRFSWGSVAGAISYNIYRTTPINKTSFSSGQQVGYIGFSNGLAFTDSNILPDFTVTPPNAFNPFADGAIEYITVTNAGSGYPYNATVTITDPTPGAGGFKGFAAIGPSGEIESVVIVDRGSGYANPTVVFTGSPGTGAVATATLTPASGNNPSVFAVFQQRGVYAATMNFPITLWGSKPGSFNDFSYSDIVVQDDSYEFTLDTGELAPIRHLFPSRGGLLIMSQTGVWLLTGGTDTAVSPINALADPQSYTGVSDVVPIAIGPDILYVEAKGSSVKLLTYNDFSRVYGGISMSIMSNHLFAADKQITSWTLSESPKSIVWSVRSDGVFLSFTYLNEQKFYAWTQCHTKGFVLDVEAVQEGIYDREYFMVQRLINGRWTKFIEQMQVREFSNIEEAWCVDCGLSLGSVSPNTTLSVPGVDGVQTVTAGSAVFSAGDVGKVLRVGGGKARVTSYTSTTKLEVTFSRPITAVIPETDIPKLADAGTWTLDAEVSSVGGLWHLEGQEVAILADGNVMPNREVVNGSVTLDYPASRVVVGIPYECLARTLPITASDAVIEEKRKRIVTLGLRRYETRGLQYGVDLDTMYDMKDRTTEPPGEPISPKTDIEPVEVTTQFDINGQIYLRQSYPLPATILGLVFDFELGDDDRD